VIIFYLILFFKIWRVFRNGFCVGRQIQRRLLQLTIAVKYWNSKKGENKSSMINLSKAISNIFNMLYEFFKDE